MNSTAIAALLGPMVSSQEPTVVHLRSRHSAAKSMWFLSGVCCLVFVPLGITAIAHGEWDGLLIFLFPAGAIAFAKWLGHVTPEDSAILYSDRMEIPREGGQRSVIVWSEVEAVQWPKHRNAEVPISIVIRADQGKETRRIPVQMKDLSPADRLTLICYLRLAGRDAKQEDWEPFCYKRAVPLLERWEPAGENVETDGDAINVVRSPPGAAVQRPVRFVGRHLFLAGILLPLILPYVLAVTVSRKMYWTISVILCISVVVNIRLVWGWWASPFTEICLAFSGACFLLGLLSPARVNASTSSQVASWPGVAFWFAAALIGCPLAGNAAVLGWIPIQFGPYVVMTAFVMLHAPIIAFFWKRSQRDKEMGHRLYAEAVCRWAAFESSRPLPICNLFS